MTITKVLVELLIAGAIIGLAFLGFYSMVPVIYVLYGLCATALILFLLSLYEV